MDHSPVQLAQRKEVQCIIAVWEGGGPAGRRRAPSQVLGALARPTTGQSCARKSPRAEIDIHRFWGRGVDLDARICDGWAWASLGIGRWGLILEYSHIHA